MDNKPSLNKPTKKLETEKIIAKINGKSIPVFKALFAADFFSHHSKMPFLIKIMLNHGVC